MRERLSIALAVLAVGAVLGIVVLAFAVGWLMEPGLPTWPALAIAAAYLALLVGAVAYVYRHPRRGAKARRKAPLSRGDGFPG